MYQCGVQSASESLRNSVFGGRAGTAVFRNSGGSEFGRTFQGTTVFGIRNFYSVGHSGTANAELRTAEYDRTLGTTEPRTAADHPASAPGIRCSLMHASINTSRSEPPSFSFYIFKTIFALRLHTFKKTESSESFLITGLENSLLFIGNKHADQEVILDDKTLDSQLR